MATPSRIPATKSTAVPAWCKGNTGDCLSSTAGSTPAAGPKTPHPSSATPSRHIRRRLGLAVLVALLALTVGASSALAARGRTLSGSFGEGQLSLIPTVGGTPGSGLAVDQATHDLYVADTGNHRVEEFSAAGAFLRAWGWGVTNGAAEAQVCTASCLPGLPGTAPGQFDAPTAIAVDNAAGGEGDVYVADSGEFSLGDNVIQKFTPEGALVTSWGSAGQLKSGPVTGTGTGDVTSGSPEITNLKTATGSLVGGEISGEGIPRNAFAFEGGETNLVLTKPATVTHVGVALTAHLAFIRLTGLGVDASGDLWVADHSQGLIEFERSGGFLQQFEKGGANPLGTAVSEAGENYIFNSGSLDIRLFEAFGGELGTVFAAEAPPTGVALNPQINELFVDEGDRIAAIAPGCAPRASAPFCAASITFGSPQLSAGAGLAVDSQSDTVYAADTAAGRVDAFALEPVRAPTVESESLTEVTGNSATFEAEINPRSLPGEHATEYQVEYGLCAAGACAGSGYERVVPLPAGSLAPDFNPHAVSVHVSDLLAGRAYHFRLIARNAQPGTGEGAERTFSTQTAGGELVLPDGRAWELVSPPDKFGASIEPISESGVVQAAADGSGITYLANAPTEPDPQGNANEVQILSSRSAQGWSSHDIAIPHTSATGKPVGAGPEYKFFNEDLTSSVVQPFGEFNPGLSNAASESTAFLHSLTTPAEACTAASSCYTPLVTAANVEPAGAQFGETARCEPSSTERAENFCGPEFLGATEDLSHIVLRANRSALKTGAGIEQLYEWGGGVLSQVSVLPDGEPAPQSEEAHLGFRGEQSLDQAARRAISADGALVVWGSGSDLYVRDVPVKETVQLDQAEAACVAAAQCSSGGGEFQIASTDGSKIFFTDQHRLTEHSGASEHKADLYECEVVLDPVTDKLKCELSDLTPNEGAQSADVQGAVLGASEDGSWIYFVADGVLTSTPNARGQQAKAGDCENSAPFSSRSCNLYVRHGATTSFIATLSGEDSHDWEQNPSSQPTRVSGNGEWLELMSAGSPTGYDNRDAQSGAPVAEVYLYDAAANRLSCASCEPSGARPSGVEYKKLEPGSGGLAGGPRQVWAETGLVAANVPGTTAIASGGQLKARYQPRYLSNSGRLFFNSADGLVPQDSNGTEDVYQYEPPGVGNCTEASATFSERSGGCVGLISSGSSGKESAFLDASEDGSDVFFLTSAKLSPQDIDTARDIYDAHECSSESPCISASSVQSPPCTTEASCKASPSPQPSIFGAPSSATFSGLGNAIPVAAVKPKAKPLTRAQKLSTALKVCGKKPKKQRAGCEAKARKQYGPLKRAKKKKGKAK